MVNNRFVKEAREGGFDLGYNNYYNVPFLNHNVPLLNHNVLLIKIDKPQRSGHMTFWTMLGSHDLLIYVWITKHFGVNYGKNQNCVSKIKSWISYLCINMLNDSKTEVLFLTPLTLKDKISIPKLKICNIN